MADSLIRYGVAFLHRLATFGRLAVYTMIATLAIVAALQQLQGAEIGKSLLVAITALIVGAGVAALADLAADILKSYLKPSAH